MRVQSEFCVRKRPHFRGAARICVYVSIYYYNNNEQMPNLYTKLEMYVYDKFESEKKREIPTTTSGKP